MTPQETKFILRTHRADGRYPAGDPLFAEALAETERTPELAAWLEREHALDETVANKLDAIQPPADLRDQILAGARASRLQRRWWQNPFWLSAAAAIILVAAIAPFMRHRGAPLLSAATLTEFALTDLAKDNHDHTAVPPAAFAIFEKLSADPRAFTASLGVDFYRMRETGCTKFIVNGQDVFEVCVERDGKWYHLYAMRRSNTAAPPSALPTITEHGRLTAATWSTESTIFTLATNEGMDALRAVI
jgi:hypothetical protein